MIKNILGNLWLWVVAAFVAVIIAWVWTIRIASNYDHARLTEAEEQQLQQQQD